VNTYLDNEKSAGTKMQEKGKKKTPDLRQLAIIPGEDEERRKK